MRKIWNKIVGWLCGIPFDKWLHFIAGVLLAAFFGIVLHMGLWCFVPVIFAGFIKEFFDQWTTGVWEWLDFLATFLGGAVIAVFFILGGLW